MPAFCRGATRACRCGPCQVTTSIPPRSHFCWACGIKEDFVTEPSFLQRGLEIICALWTSSAFRVVVSLFVVSASLPLVAAAGGAGGGGGAGAFLSSCLGAVALVLLLNTTRLENHQVEALQQPSIVNQLPDAERLGNMLAAALQIPTISYDGDDPSGLKTDYGRLDEFHALLEKTFPLLHAPESPVKRTVVGGHSLLFEWPGSEEGLAPWMLCAHLDVVPTPDEELWSHEPFSGALAPDSQGRPCIWGRGAIDNKHNVLMELQAVEGLLAAGFRPRRTLFLAFGHDEEIGGMNGARHIAGVLGQRLAGKKLEFIMDEGPFIIQGAIPGLGSRHVAMIGRAEKGLVNVRLTVDAVPSCHSSAPPPESSMGILANAIARLERHPFPSNATNFAETLEYLGTEMQLPVRIVAANKWLFAPVLKAVALRKHTTAPQLRTTTAITIVKSGVKVNLVPQVATAWVNHRIHPSDSLDDVLAYDRKVIGDKRVKLQVMDFDGTPDRWLEASPTSSLTSSAFDAIKRTVATTFGAPTAPLLMPGNTDTRHYWDLTHDIYRFTPVEMHVDDVQMFHGVNERLPVEQLPKLLRFYTALIERVDDVSHGSRPVSKSRL